MLRRLPSVVHHPLSSVSFSSETAWSMKAKVHVKPLWEGGTNMYINGPGHITKMAATPINGKNFQKSSSPEPEVVRRHVNFTIDMVIMYLQ